jgi:hypothetical protein
LLLRLLLRRLLLLLLLWVVVVVVGGREWRQPLREASRDFGGRHHRGGTERGSGGSLEGGVRVN